MEKKYKDCNLYSILFGVLSIYSKDFGPGLLILIYKFKLTFSGCQNLEEFYLTDMQRKLLIASPVKFRQKFEYKYQHSELICCPVCYENIISLDKM